MKTNICLLVLIFSLLCQNVLAQYPFAFKYPRKRQQIVCKNIRGLLVVSTYINNKGPFNIVLDTGVGVFIITNPNLRNVLNLIKLRKIMVRGLGNNPEIDAYVTPGLQVQIGNTIATDLQAAIFDTDVFDLSAFAGIPIHGLIGYDFFSSFTTQIFYPTASIVVYNNGKRNISKNYKKIPLTIENNKPYCTVNVQTCDKKNYFLKTLIDLGAGNVVSLESFNHAPFPLPNINIAANLGVGLSGDINGYIGRLKSITIGKHVINNPICAFPDFNALVSKNNATMRNGSIGTQLLKKFNIIIDYKNGFMYLKPNLNFNTEIEYDMSGLELFVGGNNLNRIFVNRVEEDSAAYIVGLQKNDELLTVNFKKVNDLGIEEIIALFQSANNRNIYIEYVRNDVITRTILTLKKRI